MRENQGKITNTGNTQRIREAHNITAALMLLPLTSSQAKQIKWQITQTSAFRFGMKGDNTFNLSCLDTTETLQEWWACEERMKGHKISVRSCCRCHDQCQCTHYVSYAPIWLNRP